MTDYVSITVQLEPAVAEMLEIIAKDANTTREAMAIEAINNMVAWVASGGDEANDANEYRTESQIDSQLAHILDTIEDFDG